MSKRPPLGGHKGRGQGRRSQRKEIKSGSRGPLRYVIFHKPYGVLSQFTGESGQRTLSEFGLPQGLYAAGRLDCDSEGLLLLTNDGPLIHSLLHPDFGHDRTYWAQVEGQPTEEDLRPLREGVAIGDWRTRPAHARLLDPRIPQALPPRYPPIRYRARIPTTWIEISLSEGKNRQVRRMTAAIGLPTLRLVRVQLGPISLFPLAPGEWREISWPVSDPSQLGNSLTL